MFMVKRYVWAAALLLAVFTTGLRAEISSVVKQVPADAPIFVVVNNLSDFSKKAATLNQKLGINSPDFTDPLGSLKALAGLNAGLDENGGVALVILSLPLPGLQAAGIDPAAAGAPAIVVLLPVTNYGAFLGNFGLQVGAIDAVSQGQIAGQPAFIKKSGSYAVLSDSLSTLNLYKSPAADNGFAARAGDVGREILGNSDIVAYVDLARVSPSIAPIVALGMLTAQQQLANIPDPATVGTATAMFGVMSDAINAILRDGQSALMGLDISGEGFGLSQSIQFKDKSPLAMTFAKAPAKALSLNRLPVRPYLLAQTMDMSAFPMKQWTEAIVAKFPEGDAFGAIMKSSLTVSLAGDQVQGAYYAPSGAPGALPALMNSVTVYALSASAKSAEVIKSTRDTIEKLNGVQIAPGMTYKTEYKANLIQVAGKQVDQYSMRIDLPPDQLAALGPAAMFLQGDMGGYLVAVPGAVVMTSGGDAVLLKDAMDTAGGTGKLDADPGIAAVRKKLGKNRVMEMFIGISPMMQMVSGFAALFAPEFAIEVPANLPPVALAASAGGGGLSSRFYVPMEVVQAIKGIFDKFAQGQAPAAAIEDPAKNVLILSEAKP